MKIIRTLIVLAGVLGIAPLSSAANKEMIELQRDVMTLQDQVRQLNEKLVALTTLMQASLDNTRQSNTAIGVMQAKLEESLKEQKGVLVAPVANVSQKLEAMSQDFQSVRETVLDLNSRMGKLDAKITDLQNLMNNINSQRLAPPPPTVPDGSANGGAPAGGSTAPAGPPTPPPGMKAGDSYTNAYRDYIAGSYDLALSEFTDYLKYFPTADFASGAQYYVGDIYYKRKDYENAIIAFDAVLEHFSDNSKTPDAHLMKGRSLQALGKRDSAAKEYKETIAKYPETPAAAKAKTLLKELGLASSSSTPARPKKKR
jgi:tol-pal system protein YbgF